VFQRKLAWGTGKLICRPRQDKAVRQIIIMCAEHGGIRLGANLALPTGNRREG
jgi:hypothetical protein